MRICLPRPAAVLALAFAASLAPSVAAQQAAIVVHTSPASVGIEGFRGAVTVTPSTPASVVAREMAARPAGQRSLLLEGFADDLTSVDVVAVPALKDRKGRVVRPASTFPSPWLDMGASRARGRSAAWFAAYVSAGGPAIDLAVIRCRATLAASQYLARVTPTGWNAVAQDQRFPALAAAIGVPNLRRSIFSSASAREAWTRYFDRAVDAQLHSAVGGPLLQAFPEAIVCGEDRYCAAAGQLTIAARSGITGVPQHVPFKLAGVATPGFVTLGTMLTELSRLRGPGTAIPTVPAPASPRWNGSAGTPALAPILQAEFIAQLAASGYRHAWSPSAGWNTASGTAVAAMVRESNARLGGGPPSRSASEPTFDSARFLVRGSVRDGIATWRISMADGIEAATARFQDGGTAVVSRGGIGSGGWLSHPESRRLESVELHQSAVPPASEGGFLLLSDDLPGQASPASIPANRYMIIYQGVDPQSYASARISPANVIAAVHAEIAAGRWSEWGVLDFEDPFNEIMDHGPSDPRWQSAMGSLIDTVRAVKSAFPTVRWTYYNFPRVGYWNFERDWSSLTAAQRDAVRQDAVARYAPLMEELDWFMPSIYDRYERAGLDPSMRDFFVGAERSFRVASVDFLRRYMDQPGKVRRPVIPMASPWFIEGGRAPQWRAIPVDELIADQVAPTIAAGADGIALWCVTGWLSTIATREGTGFSAYSLQEQARFRAQFATDRLGGAVPPGYQWGSPSSVALVRSHLADVVAGAVEAVSQSWLQHQSQPPSGLPGNVVFAGP